tara:strand:+ start:345 stop:677 length:333 start_codon:yes stop_codon:yes gene_type:complete
MAAAEYNITISQNADFTRSFQLKEANVVVDITNKTFAGKIKKNYNETTGTDFTAVNTNNATGLWTMSLTDTQTAALKAGDNVYDIVMTDTVSGDKTRLLQGKAFVSPGVS